MATRNGQLDTSIEVITPENISFEYRVAGPFRRYLAYLIDLALRLFVFVVLYIGVMLLFGSVGLYTSQSCAGFGNPANIASFVQWSGGVNTHSGSVTSGSLCR